MSWREQLRPAGFRGAAFEVAEHSADAAGRRFVMALGMALIWTTLSALTQVEAIRLR